jgi:opacity protein-like surface antigen
MGGLALVALPISAGADTAKTIVEAMAGAALQGIVCSSVALTADPDAEQGEYSRRGWSVGVAGSYAFETFQDDAESDFQKVTVPNAALTVDDTAGFNARVTYRCHKRFSTEVQVEWLESFDAEGSATGFGDIASIKFEPVVVTANTKVYILTERFQPFLLVGAGAMTADAKLNDMIGGLGLSSNESENSFAMRFGGGIDVYATKNAVVSLEASYVLPIGDLDALDYVMIGWGFQYRF